MPEILNLPKGHAILQSSTVEMTLQKSKFRIHKIYDSVKDIDYQLCFDKQHKQIDLNKIIKKEQELYSEKYGKLHPALFNVLSKKPKIQKAEIIVWLKPALEEPLKTGFSVKNLLPRKLPKKYRKPGLKF